MKKKLIIVESPGKIKKIKSILGNEYIVLASQGHIRDLAKKTLSIDINNNFKPTYVINDDKKSVVANIKKYYTSDTELIIAADGDREGEAIGYHLIEILKPKEYSRIIFYSITKKEILDALKNTTKINMNIVYAQQTRRLLDRIVGYKLSPLLNRLPKLNNIKSLGAGRVQSVITKLIVQKELEIKNHLTNLNESEYEIIGNFLLNNKKFICNLKFNSCKFIENKLKYTNIKLHKLDVESFLKIIKNDPIFFINNLLKKIRFRHPPQPFITTSLQKDCSYKLKLPILKTMQIAQKLYELGLITYMRTDSPNLSDECLSNIKKYILNDNNLGNKYYKFRQFKTKNSNAQEAHEAIRPSNIKITDLSEYNLSNSIEEKVYKIIWKRTISSQMSSAEYSDTIVSLLNTYKVKFEGNISILTFDGYLKIYNDIDDSQELNDITIDNLKINDIIKWSNIIATEKFKAVPSRYNEVSIVEKLENLGIGRPATYASMINKIQEHNYVKIDNIEGIKKSIKIYYLDNKLNLKIKSSFKKIGNENNKLVPTEIGNIVTEYLNKYFENIMDYKFTANMEKQLDNIADGKIIWYNVLNDFYNILKKSLDNFINILEVKDNIKITRTEMDIIGKYNNNEIYYLVGKYGPVIKVKYGKKDLFVSVKSKPDNKLANSLIKSKIDYNKKIIEYNKIVKKK